MNRSNFKTVTNNLQNQIKILGGFVVLIWAIQIVNFIVFNSRLTTFGIHPQNPSGLLGILFAPFLHGSFSHVAANTVPFLILGWFVMLRGIDQFFFVSVVSALVSGLGTWAIASPSDVHIGASGMIFGYLGYLLLRGWFERSIVAIAMSLIVAFFYGGLIWGVLPGQLGISWQGHLFGFLGGALAAKLLAEPTHSNQ
jgi:membrane associated rhomboid family serine protease